jgi:hypothetical protein
MTVEDYIENLNRLKGDAVGRFADLSATERRLVDGSFDWLIDNLKIQKGQVQPDTELTQAMNDFVGAVNSIINGDGTFNSKLTQFLSDLSKIQANNKRFHITTNKFNIETAGVSEIQKTVVNEIIDQYTGNGLNSNFTVPLRDLIYRNILGGMNMREARGVLQNYIMSGKDNSGKLSQYLNQTAQQAVDSYTGMINQQLQKEFKFTGYIISGSLIVTSSAQCVYAIQHSDSGYLSFKEWQKVLAIARANGRAPLIEGTNIANLPINKLHWGCRHDFTPIIQKEN